MPRFSWYEMELAKDYLNRNPNIRDDGSHAPRKRDITKGIYHENGYSVECGAFAEQLNAWVANEVHYRNGLAIQKHEKLHAEALERLEQKQIDTSDIPEVDENWFKNARRVSPKDEIEVVEEGGKWYFV